jgi:hypothetical protein
MLDEFFSFTLKEYSHSLPPAWLLEKYCVRKTGIMRNWGLREAKLSLTWDRT